MSTRKEVVAELVAEEATALTKHDQGPAKVVRRHMLSDLSGTALDRNPVAVYLARFTSKAGHRVQLSALQTVARLFKVDDPHVMPWSELRYAHVVDLRTKLSQDKAPAYVNRILSAIRGVAQEAVRLDVLNAAEGAKIAAVSGVKGSRVPAGRHLESDVDIEPLFDGVAEHVNPTIAVRDRALLGVLRVTGVRRTELVDMQLDDIDAKWRLVTLGKGKKERYIYLDAVKEDIKEWLKLRGRASGPLFCAVHKHGQVLTRDGVPRPMNSSSIGYIVNRAGDLGGVEHVSAHDFRRTYVGDLLDSGADISTVARLAGHSSVTTTQLYDRRPDRTAEAAAGAIQMPPKKKRKKIKLRPSAAKRAG